MRLMCALSVLFSLATSAPALAFDEPLSRQHFERGKALARLGKHRESIMEFELAYQANPRASILYNLGHEHRVLAEAGGIEEMRTSAEFYRKYLEMMPNAPDRVEVRTMIADLRARIESAEASARNLPVKELPPPPDKAPVTDAPRSEEPERALPIVPEPGRERDGKVAPKASRKWLWVGIGVGAAVVAGTAIGLGVGLTRDNGAPQTILGNQGATFQ